MNIPRIMIAAAASGSGKTALTCALLEVLKRRGRHVAAGKCGPDYIDPLFHRQVLGVPSENLDLFFLEENQLRRQFVRHTASSEIALVEGVMGYYDGIGLQTTRGSSYDLSKTLETPVVLVVPCRGMAISVVAQIMGFLEFRKDHLIQGIIFNRISEMLYPRMKEMVETELQKLGYEIAVLGYLPEREEFALESRHLGLRLPEEIKGLKEQMHRAGEIIENTIDLEAFLALAKKVPEMRLVESKKERTAINEKERVRIGIARDAAFQFYYPDNLELLMELGCELLEFSPISDYRLPEGIQGLLLGGGYPELYAEALSKNEPMRRQIQKSIAAGMPCLAECGGFLYLQTTLEDLDGKNWPMVGALDGRGYRTSTLRRFGYVNLQGMADGRYLKKGECIRGHEFHYWDCTQNGEAVKAVKPDGKRSWNCICEEGNLFAGFPHLAYRSNPEFARRFVEMCMCKGHS
ncbi:MAG: cobyrinate a,c-diamide synthase [Hespellia sp.]|nr:cobyrinate a,c-diamide synthase [Hespellia sp.]